MTNVESNAVIIALIERLAARGSWCGETHVQKATYFVEELCKVPLNFEFMLYKHGPFSFDLRDRLTALRADGFLSLDVVQAGYGPRIRPTEQAISLKTWASDAIRTYQRAIEFIADRLGNKNISELECLATALLVTSEGGHADRAVRINELKPHVPILTARDAVKEVDEIKREFSQLN